MKKVNNKTLAFLTLLLIFLIIIIATYSVFSKKTKKNKVQTKEASKIISYPKTGKARLDSLLACIPDKGEPQDTNFVKLLSNISHEYHTIDQEKGIEYAQRALKLAEKLNFKEYLPDIYMVWGNNLNMSYNILGAIIKYNQALKLFEDNYASRGVSA